MEYQTFSFRSVSLAALLHALVLFLLLYLVQSDPLSLVQEKQEQEAAVVFMPQTQPPIATGQTAQSQIMQNQLLKDEPHEKESTPNEIEPELEQPRSQPQASPKPSVHRSWSPDLAKQAWRKKAVAAAPTHPFQTPQEEYQDGLMHKIIEGIPIAKHAVPLRQRLNAQWVKEGQENYQHGVIKTICYELNKQRIMEASSNLPRKIVFKVMLERSGKLIDAQLIEKSYSASFDQACLRAIFAASPYRPVPATVEGDPVTLLFSLYHDRSQGPSNSNVPTPITFYIN